MLWTQEAIDAELAYRRQHLVADRDRTSAAGVLRATPDLDTRLVTAMRRAVGVTRRTARAKHRAAARQPVCPA